MKFPPRFKKALPAHSFSAPILRGAAVTLLALASIGDIAAQTGAGAVADRPETSAERPMVVLPPSASGSISQGAPETRQKQASEQANANRQSINVSGWWVIDVKNPDGTTAKHQEFENTITQGGIQTLVYLLSGQITAGAPYLKLGTSSGTSPCSSSGCQIFPGTINQSYCDASQDCSGGLTTTIVPVPQAQPDAVVVNLVLAGQSVAVRAGTIDNVLSGFFTCSTTAQPAAPGSPVTNLSPSTCIPNAANIQAIDSGLSGQGFTSASMSPINIQAGQTVQISVTFSFASLS